MADFQLRRTMLYVPGNMPSMLQNVPLFHCDSVIIDLEDAVNYAEKDAARDLVRCFLESWKDRNKEVLVRINGLIDGMRDTIATAMQVNLSMVAIDDNEVTKRLAAWAAIFGICTAFVGVWGMNFEHMPELKFKYGYPLALGVIAVVCAYVYYRFRKAKWL